MLYDSLDWCPLRRQTWGCLCAHLCYSKALISYPKCISVAVIKQPPRSHLGEKEFTFLHTNIPSQWGKQTELEAVNPRAQVQNKEQWMHTGMPALSSLSYTVQSPSYEWSLPHLWWVFLFQFRQSRQSPMGKPMGQVVNFSLRLSSQVMPGCNKLAIKAHHHTWVPQSWRFSSLSYFPQWISKPLLPNVTQTVIIAPRAYTWPGPASPAPWFLIGLPNSILTTPST